MARDPHDRARHPYTHGAGSNANQAAESGAWPERPQTDEPADRQEGDQRAHVEDLAADIEGQVYSDADDQALHDQAPDDERSPRDAADSPDDRKPQGSRAPG